MKIFKKNSENHKIRHEKQGTNISFMGMMVTGVIMLALIVVLAAVQKNVTYTLRDESIKFVDVDKVSLKSAPRNAKTLIIYQDDEAGIFVLHMMSDILNQMKIDFDEVVYTKLDTVSYTSYEKIVLAVTDYQYFADDLVVLRKWTKDGGQLMITYPPVYSSSFVSFSSLFGIKDCGEEGYSVVEGFHFIKDFMIGGTEKDFVITDPYESSLVVSLTEDCEVFMESTDQYPIPLIWRRNEGKGTVVFGNMGFMEKAYRGFYASIYSLLGDTCTYPVINGSTFFIDDFPSPVPGGEGKYITRDYGMSIKDFYTNIWWEDMYNLAKDHGALYTGLVIEDYSDQVSGTFKRQKDTERFIYFGNMLLDMGGEIGFHGYNHMPLVLENFDYEGLYDSYKQWKSYDDMKAGFTELAEYCESLYPDESFQVYVPPSNIISKEGREMLAEDFPSVKSIASVYIGGELAYDQEFEVTDSGIISTPRIISGYILDDFCDIIALSELNFHYVNTHFQHPDDVLDEDRGAALGWNQMLQNLTNYMDWLYNSAPKIRNLTGSELAAAVQRYDYIDVERIETKDKITLNLENFYDEAWLMIRLNRGQQITEIEGGEFEKVGDQLFSIKANQDQVIINLK